MATSHAPHQVSHDATAPATDAKRRALSIPWSAVLGWLLVMLYFVITQLIPPTGRSEFSYLPFFPEFHVFSAMRGFTFEQLLGHGLRVCLLGPGLWLMSVGLAPLLNPGSLQQLKLGRVHVWAGALSLAITAYVMLCVLRGRAILDDEVTYALMARTFARGLLAEPAYAGQVLDWDLLTRAGISGKYLFGEPLVQVLGVRFGIPALPHLFLNAVTLGAFYRSVQLLSGRRTLASVSCALLAISPTFMLCAATGLSETTSLCCVSLGILGYALAAKRSQLWGALLAGGAVGLGMSVRIQTLVPAGFALGCAFLLLALRSRKAVGVIVFTCASLLGAAPVAAYNQALTGSPWTLPWFLQGEGIEHYGFVRVWSERNFVHTPLDGLQNLAVVAVRMNAWWLGWPLAFLMWFRGTTLRRVVAQAPIFLGVAAALVAFEFGYYSPGPSDVGPIYHFELLLCLSVIAGNCLIELWEAQPKLALTALILHVGLATSSFIWEQSVRLGHLANLIHSEPTRVLQTLPDRSLLLYEPSCQHRVRVGWMLRGFALVEHDPDAAVITYPRPAPARLDEFVANFPRRRCYFLDYDTQHGAFVRPCDDARAQLLRPYTHAAEDCVYSMSTAMRLGLLTPPPTPDS